MKKYICKRHIYHTCNVKMQLIISYVITSVLFSIHLALLCVHGTAMFHICKSVSLYHPSSWVVNLPYHWSAAQVNTQLY